MPMGIFDSFQPKKSRNALEGPITDVPIEIAERRIYVQCPGCRHVIDTKRMEANGEVCPRCGHHLRLNAAKRLAATVDAGSFEAWDEDVTSTDFLHFPSYQDKLASAKKRSGESEAVLCGRASIGGMPCALFIMNGDFMMGSMGSAVGEKIARCFERACELRLPVVGFTVSGGARMQEGVTSLMQMAKTSAAVQRHSDSGLLYIAVLTDPTSGGVTASFAMEADITLAEPGALVAFAGPRVIEQTIHRKLPAGFQSAEFQLEHGFVDAIVKRAELPQTLASLLELHAAPRRPDSFVDPRPDAPGAPWSPGAAPRAGATAGGNAAAAASAAGSPAASKDGNASKDTNATGNPAASAAGSASPDAETSPASGTAGPTAYERVRNARSTKRMTTLGFIGQIFNGFIELHGDRAFADDKAMVGGLAWLGGRAVTVVGTERGSSTKDRVQRNFGSAHPEGYRKALRLMKQAEKFGRPVVCFIDTAGAFCGIAAEERGQGQAIAQNLMAMSALQVPVISIVIGEGGSGGALGLGVGNQVWMLENAVYSVISPEGCASILYKDAAKAAEAAEALGLTAQKLLELGIIDSIIKEPGGDVAAAARELQHKLASALAELSTLSGPGLAEQRYARFRRIGVIA